MKSQTKMAIKVFGGAAAVAVAVGLGGVGVNAAGSNPAASGSSTDSGSGVHSATLTTFYVPHTCTPAPCR